MLTYKKNKGSWKEPEVNTFTSGMVNILSHQCKHSYSGISFKEWRYKDKFTMFFHHFRWRPEVIHSNQLMLNHPIIHISRFSKTFKQLWKFYSEIISGEIKKILKAEIDNWCPPEVDISNTSILKKRTILLRVTRKILIAFQTLSKKCRF